MVFKHIYVCVCVHSSSIYAQKKAWVPSGRGPSFRRRSLCVGSIVLSQATPKPNPCSHTAQFPNQLRGLLFGPLPPIEGRARSNTFPPATLSGWTPPSPRWMRPVPCNSSASQVGK